MVVPGQVTVPALTMRDESTRLIEAKLNTTLQAERRSGGAVLEVGSTTRYLDLQQGVSCLEVPW